MTVDNTEELSRSPKGTMMGHVNGWNTWSVEKSGAGGEEVRRCLFYERQRVKA